MHTRITLDKPACIMAPSGGVTHHQLDELSNRIDRLLCALGLPIERPFPLAPAAQTLAHMKANAHFGKIVLVV